MKTTYPVAIMIATAALLLAPVPSLGQAPALARSDDQVSDKARAERAERLAQQFQRNALQLTVFDREGKLMRTVGERAMYDDPKFSPDRTRLAVTKRDLEAETRDVWVLDVATGNSTQITSSQTWEGADSPVWSPDGSQVAYVAVRGSYFGLYRKASNGEGEEELLYQHPGGSIFLTGWSLDGRLLSFSTGDRFGSAMYFFPLDGDGQVIEIARSEARMRASNLSPDGRFLAYMSNETGRREIFVRSVVLPGGAENASGEKWQISTEGAIGLHSWRRDGQELYYLGIDRGVMAVEVNTAQGFEFGQPRLRFKAPDAILARTDRGVGNISQDGERVVFAVPPAILQQITVLDRQGKVLSTVGEPGRYGEPTLSPDGTRVAVERVDLQTGDLDIWTFDVASGQGTPVHDDHSTGFFDPIWSPDGRYVAYVGTDSTPQNLNIIYRKAWDGTGNEEQLFQYTPGAWMELTDWSADGKFLTFHDGCEGVLHVVPLSGDQNALERPAIEWLRDEYSVAQARLSPDSRFMAYLSDETEVEIFEVYVRPFDASRPEAGAGGAKPVQVSNAGARGMIFWRQDGKELIYLTSDWEVMAVEVTTTPTFQAGTPRLLFRFPGRLDGDPRQWKNVSGDGQRFVFAMDVPVSTAAP